MTPEIRESQLLTLKQVSHTAMAVLTDAGEADNIHPINKQIVGMRLSLAARALAYKEDIEYSGPLYKSMKIEGDKVVLSFTHVGSGLMAKGGDLRGFTIAGKDKEFVPATAVIRRNKVIVTSSQVARPVAVRYGWSNVPNVNLYNQDGLPASPFRTDLPLRSQFTGWSFGSAAIHLYAFMAACACFWERVISCSGVSARAKFNSRSVKSAPSIFEVPATSDFN